MRFRAGYLSQRDWAAALNSRAGARHEVSRWERGLRIPDAWLPVIAESLELPLATLARAAAVAHRAGPGLETLSRDSSFRQ